MTVYSTTFETDWVATDGIRKDFNYDFTVFLVTDFYILRKVGLSGEEIRVDSGFTMTPTNSAMAGGKVTYPSSGAAIAAGSYIKLVREVDYTQTQKIGNEGPFRPDIHERAFDRLTQQTQQLAGGVEDIRDRAWFSVNGGPGGLITKGAPGQYAQYDALGNLIPAPATGGPNPDTTRIYPQNYGAKADLVFEEQDVPVGAGGGTRGFIRLSGTNDRAAILEAQEVALALGQPLWFYGQYYIKGEIERKVPWLSVVDFGTVLWFHYGWDSATMDLPESGMVCKTSGAWFGGKGDYGFRVIGQFDTLETKPSGNGQRGTIGRINDYWSNNVPMPILDNMVERFKAVRAGHNLAVNQRSGASIYWAQMAGVKNFHIQYGVWGKTNVSAQCPWFAHWGAQIDFNSIKVGLARIDNPGSGYATAPTVTFSGGGGGVTRTASGYATVSGGLVTGIVMEDYGEGYTQAPTISFSGGGGSGAAATSLFGPTQNKNRTMANCIESYHSECGIVEQISEIDNDNGYNFIRPYELACTGHVMEMGGTTNGLPAGLGWVTSGDVGDAFTCEAQKGKILVGNRVKRRTAKNVVNVAGEGAQAFFIKGLGTSKFQNDREVGSTTLFKTRQPFMEVKCEGFYSEHEAADPLTQRGIWVADCHGDIDLGSVRIVSASRAVEIENSSGEIVVRQTGGGGCLINNFSTGVHFLAGNTNRSTAANSGDTDNYAPGYAAPNSRAIEVVGGKFAIQLNGAINPGDIVVTVDPLTADVYCGNLIQVGTEELTVLETTQAGGTVIAVSPVLSAVADNTAGNVIQDAVVRKLEAGYASSYNGLRILRGKVFDADLGDVQWTGRHAASVTDGVLQITKGKWPKIGRMAAGSNFTIALDTASKLVVRDVDIPANVNINRHIQLSDTSILDISGCRIEDLPNLMTAVTPDKQVRFHDNWDYAHNRVASPYHRGTHANGEWTKYEDGTLECYLRNVVIPIGGYTWTFPQTPIAIASTVVHVQNTNTGLARFVAAINSLTASATIQMFDVAGAPIAGGASLRMIGRWY